MIDTEHEAGGALPLVAAAARLGITTDALRMRLRRGKARGFKRDRHVYVYLTEQDLAAYRAGSGPAVPGPSSPGPTAPWAATSTQANEPGAQAESTRYGELVGGLQEDFRKSEVTHLLRENERLNLRLDLLIAEMQHLHKMQQREQILRQQDQNLQQQLQATVDKLTLALALPRPAAPRLGIASPDSGLPDSVHPDRAAPDGTPEGAFGPQGPQPKDRRAATGPSRPSGLGGGPGDGPEGETEDKSGNAVTESPTPASPAAAGKPVPAVQGRVETGLDEPGATAPQEIVPRGATAAQDGLDSAERETAELANLLRSLGQSLRDLDTTQAPDSKTPDSKTPDSKTPDSKIPDPMPSAIKEPLLLHRRVSRSDPLPQGTRHKAPLDGHSEPFPRKSHGGKSRFLKRLFGNRSRSQKPAGPAEPIRKQGS